MATLSETAETKRRFSELLSSLSESLPSLADQVDGLADRMLPGLCPRDQLDWLDVLAGEVTARGLEIDELAAAGDQLIAILTELDCRDTPKARQILSDVERVRRQLEDIMAAVDRKRVALEAALARLMEAHAKLAAALAWLDDAEARVSTLLSRGVSLNKARLADQISEHRAFAADVTAYTPNVGTVAERCASVWIEGRVSELQDRHHALVQSLDEHDGRLDDIRRRLAGLLDGVAALDQWIGSTVGAVGRRSVDLEELCAARQTKRHELDSLTSAGRELTSDSMTTDKHCLRDAVSDLRARWRELMQLLTSTVSNAATVEIDELTKFASEASEKMKNLEPITSDVDAVVAQLRDFKTFHEEMYSKRESVDRTLARCRRMLQESPSEEQSTVDVDIQLTVLREQFDALCLRSDRRLLVLKELIPLVSHFSQLKLELQAWLHDIAADVEALDGTPGDITPDTDDHAEQLRMCRYNVKTTLQLVEDHHSEVDEVVTTSQEIASLCTDLYDASPIIQQASDLSQQFESRKQTVRRRLDDLEAFFRQIFTDTADSISMMVDTIRSVNDRVSYGDDEPTLNVVVIRQLVAENSEMLADLNRVSTMMQDVAGIVGRLPETSGDEDNEEKYVELENRLQEAGTLHRAVLDLCQRRERRLQKALDAAEKLHSIVSDISSQLSHIRDDAAAIHSVPATDRATIQHHLSELQTFQCDLQSVETRIAHFRKDSEKNSSVDGVTEVHKYVSELEDMYEEVVEALKHRMAELESELERTENYSSYYEAVMTWLPNAEMKLMSMALIATNPRSVRIQIEEFKVFRVQMCKWQLDVHTLNQFIAELKRTSQAAAVSAVIESTAELNSRWNKLTLDANEREAELRNALIELGEVEHAMEDVMGLLQQVETDLQQFGEVYGDPRHIEVHLRKIQILLKELSSQKRIIDKLEDTIEVLVKRSGRSWSPLTGRQQELVSTFIDIQASARERRDELLDRLNEVKSFVSSADDLMKWLEDFRRKLQWCTPLGALPDSARSQLKKLLDAYHELEGKEMEVMAMMLNGEDMFVRCRDHEAQLLRRKLVQLKAGLNDTKAKANKIKCKMEEHVRSVERFHAALATQSSWLAATEKSLRAFKVPSKLMDGVQAQICSLKVLRSDIERHSAEMKHVDQTGTYLKYFGSKQDTIYVRNRLSSIRLRWKRLLRRVDETSRRLDRALRDAKRFDDLWKSLFEWLEASEDNLQKFVIGVGVRTKQDFDELRRFESQMSSKQPSYCLVRRLGVALCNRCDKEDVEREQLTEMLCSLGSLWHKMRTVAAHRHERNADSVDMITSDGISETVSALLSWLSTAESYLSDTKPVLGDVETVSMLMQQHQDFQQELIRRMEVAHQLQDSIRVDSCLTDDDRIRLSNLEAAVSRIQRLADSRLRKLHAALKLAEDFSEAVEAVNEWLPLAEAELKFRALPDEEDGLMRWIENHEKFDEELRAQQPDIDRMVYVSEEILISCHRSAERCIRYQLSTIQTRWQQALRRSKLRATRLHEALHDMRHSATRCKDLEAWLVQMHSLLTSRDGHTIPPDVKAIETLISQHNRLHQELIGRKPDVERLNAAACEVSNSAEQADRSANVSEGSKAKTRSFTPPGTAYHGRTPPVTASARSRTPPGSVGRSKTPPVTGTSVRVLPSVRSLTPPVSGSQSRATTAVTQQRRSVTPPGSGNKPTKSRVPSGSPSRRQLPSPSPVQGSGKELTGRRGSTALWERYRLLLELSAARKKQLTDALERQQEKKVCNSFDFNEWRKRCADWLRAKRLRAADLFRQQDRSANGTLSRRQFVDAMTSAKLPSSYAELNAVFDMYDVTLSGHINYRELVKTVDRQSVVARLCGEPSSVVCDSEFIHEEVRQQQRRCICPSRFPVHKVDNGKYKFGDRGKLCLVRFVNSSVTVRVGGGWKTLEEFFDSNDPCRLRYRPMRGGQMTPPDVVVRGRDDQISARMAWNQASLTRNLSFCSPRWNTPTFSTPYGASARLGAMTSDGSRPMASRMMANEVRPTATWPRTPKPQKPPLTGPGSPRSARKTMRSGDHAVRDIQPLPSLMKRSM